MLVHEVLSRNMRDRRAVARYAGLTGSPDESGKGNAERKGWPARAMPGSAGTVQLAWRFLLHQKNSALTKWFRSAPRTLAGTQKPMICGLGAQATDRPVAAPAGGHCPGWRCFASGTMNEGR